MNLTIKIKIYCIENNNNNNNNEDMVSLHWPNIDDFKLKQSVENCVVKALKAFATPENTFLPCPTQHTQTISN